MNQTLLANDKTFTIPDLEKFKHGTSMAYGLLDQLSQSTDHGDQQMRYFDLERLVTDPELARDLINAMIRDRLKPVETDDLNELRVNREASVRELFELCALSPAASTFKRSYLLDGSSHGTGDMDTETDDAPLSLYELQADYPVNAIQECMRMRSLCAASIHELMALRDVNTINENILTLDDLDHEEFPALVNNRQMLTLFYKNQLIKRGNYVLAKPAQA